MKQTFAFLSLYCVLILFNSRSVFGQAQRPMSVEDLFGIEQLGQIAVSPDGEQLAVVVKRACTTAETYKKDFLWDNDRADIWLVSRSSGERRNLTNGVTDGSGYWNPVWSPDGARLALLSTRGGDNVRLYVWEKGSGKIRRLTEDGAQTPGAVFGFGAYNPVLWVDHTRLLCPVLPAGEQPLQFRLEIQTPRIASAEWPKAARGLETTASVLDSGIPNAAQPDGQLLLIDVESGELLEVAKGRFSQIIPSPDRRHVALIADAGPASLGHVKRLRFDAMTHRRCGILSLGRTPAVQWITNLFDPPGDAYSSNYDALAWSPNSSQIALIAKTDPEQDRPATLYLISVPTGESRILSPENIEVSAVTWTGASTPLFYGRRIHPAAAKPDARLDWWLASADGPEMSARNLSGSLKTAPFPLIATSDPNGMLGLAEGKLGRFDAQKGRWQEIKESPSKIESIVWPKPEGLNGRPISQLLVQATLEGSKQFHRLDVTASGAKLISALTVPSEASLVDYSPAKDLVLYSTKTSEGTFLWSNNGGNGAVVRRFSINEHLAKISEPRRVLIDYYSGDGQILQGLVLLPIGYREGTRYPLITYVYPGTIIRTPNYFAAYKNSLIMLNLQLLASKGYVVLIPSIPLGPEGEASDPYLDIPKGVLPALDKVIEKGIADPDRLGVIGQSYGGYGVYGLVTFTHRFKAAISLAGLSNLVSLYGTFDARTRYTDESSIRMNQAALAETSQVRMGNTLWVDSTRYIRNSPIFYLDRVETPLLIIQGDLDYVAIQQGEEFFTGLHRLGKRARFVRYWGEGHGPHSPANVRDMWGRIYDWFSEHLARKD